MDRKDEGKSQQTIHLTVDQDMDTLDKLGYVCAKSSNNLEQLAQNVERVPNRNPYIQPKLFRKARSHFDFKTYLTEQSEVELCNLLGEDPESTKGNDINPLIQYMYILIEIVKKIDCSAPGMDKYMDVLKFLGERIGPDPRVEGKQDAWEDKIDWKRPYMALTLLVQLLAVCRKRYVE